MKARVIAVAVVLVVAATASAVFFSRPGTDVRSDEERRWLERIEATGVKTAKAELKDVLLKLNVLEAHDEAHAFGGALYNAGAPLTECPVLGGDEFLSSGCSHEYIGRAIGEHGLGSVSAIEASCSALSRQEYHLCEHGIGHGLIGYLGYSEENLTDALDACSVTGDYNCYRGAFMEHDFRRLIDGTIQPRLPEGDEMERGACDSYSGPMQSVCVYWQPNWWFAALTFSGADKNNVTPRLYELCGQWEGIHRNLCYAGIGFNIYYWNPDIDRAREVCNAEFAEGGLFCKIGAASRFRSVGVEVPEVEKICSGLSGQDLEQCRNAAQGAVDALEGLPRGLVW